VTPEPALAVPAPRSCPFAPPADYQRLREQSPVSRVTLPNGRPAWAVARHEDLRALLSDPRFSSDRARPGFPSLLAGSAPEVTRGTASLISMDPPEHGPARREVLGEFTVRRMQALRPRIQQIVDRQLELMTAGLRPADLVAALALPVPSLVICELLGVPYADHDFFQDRSARLLRHTTPGPERLQVQRDLSGYLRDLVARKVADPGDDLLGRQVVRQREAGGARPRDLAALAFLLLVAGHETTSNMISLGVLGFLENPAAREAVRAEPARTPGAVEELLRYFSIVDVAVGRMATADIEIGDVLIRAGEGVVALSSTANRDPAAFGHADELDIERGERHHLAFGFGPHQCLGQNLARLELQVVFDSLLRRIPDLRLAVPLDDVPFKDDAIIYGAYELPVTWTP
jgi:cytochrome P450